MTENPVEMLMELVLISIVFYVCIHISLGLGPVLHESAEGIPFGNVIKLFIPGPDGLALDWLKAVFNSSLFTLLPYGITKTKGF